MLKTASKNRKRHQRQLYLRLRKGETRLPRRHRAYLYNRTRASLAGGRGHVPGYGKDVDLYKRKASRAASRRGKVVEVKASGGSFKKRDLDTSGYARLEKHTRRVQSGEFHRAKARRATSATKSGGLSKKTMALGVGAALAALLAGAGAKHRYDKNTDRLLKQASKIKKITPVPSRGVGQVQDVANSVPGSTKPDNRGLRLKQALSIDKKQRQGIRTERVGRP